jgi:hypothetical protein
MIDYNTLIGIELPGVYGDILQKVNTINKWYSIYDGDQAWEIPEGLDYSPTRKITNLIKKLIDFRARFMFGQEPYFDIRPVKQDAEGSTKYQDEAGKKEILLEDILKANKFHSKLLKARKDCSIGGKVAIKLWADRDEGLKIVFSPAQEFFPQFNEDDIDLLEKVIFLYALNTEELPENQRIKKQAWEMVGDKCILNEGIYNGKAELIEELFTNHDTGLDFIPVIIIQNGGLTGETEGVSDVELLWSNQDAYNRLTSDDIDALRFQMFGQDVITDAEENSIKNIKIAPGALIDLQTDPTAGDRQAKVERLESRFTYADKFADTVNRIKNDLYDTLDVPNVGLEQLKGLMQSGKSMKALYWSLMAACDEDWTEWRPALEQMVDFIFRMVDIYNLYGSRQIAKYETTLEIHHFYPIPEDEADDKHLDMEEVAAQLRSRKSYMKKWGEYEDINSELEQIQLEQQMLKDDFTRALEAELGDE